MKKIILAGLAVFYVTQILAQKENSQFAVFGGYENFPNLAKESGYNVGIEFKHYIHKQFFMIANFHAGINNGNIHPQFTKENQIYSYNLKEKERNYMIGIGLGADLLQKGRHKLYVQSTVGLGNADKSKDHIVSIGSQETQRKEDNYSGYAISATIGYDYQLTRWLSAGIHYTGYQINQYKNSCNAKISILF